MTASNAFFKRRLGGGRQGGSTPGHPEVDFSIAADVPFGDRQDGLGGRILHVDIPFHRDRSFRQDDRGFRFNVTGDSGNVTDDSDVVTDRSGIVTVGTAWSTVGPEGLAVQ